MPKRVCPTPGCPTLIEPGRRYCPQHTRERERRRGSSTARGYGTQHKALRKAWQARIDAGAIVHCARGCGRRVTGSAWDLGHTDDRAAYLGPECIPCNRGDGGRRAHL